MKHKKQKLIKEIVVDRTKPSLAKKARSKSSAYHNLSPNQSLHHYWQQEIAQLNTLQGSSEEEIKECLINSVLNKLQLEGEERLEIARFLELYLSLDPLLTEKLK